MNSLSCSTNHQNLTMHTKDKTHPCKFLNELLESKHKFGITFLFYFQNLRSPNKVSNGRNFFLNERDKEIKKQ